MTTPFYKIVLGTAILAMSNLAAVAQRNTIKPAYDFSLSRDEKIKLAESADPPEVSSKATVYVLDSTGYVKVRDGSNGFSCFVDRQAPVNLEPTCFDAEGSATTLLTRFFVEAQRAQGKNEDQIKADLDEGYRTGKFQAPRKPGIVLHAFRPGLPFGSHGEQIGSHSAASDVLCALCHRQGYRFPAKCAEHASRA